MKKITFPIGIDNFREMRIRQDYYVDKSLFIRDFIEFNNKVSLITRPRRFGKTLNMTMLKEFFDITKDSGEIFKGLLIMDTPYARGMNTRPVVFLTFKNCRGDTVDRLRLSIIRALLSEYMKYVKIIGDNDTYESFTIKSHFDKLKNKLASMDELRTYLADLIECVSFFYGTPPLLLIDEYDQPIISSYEHGFREEMTDFFSVFLGEALKGNENLGQALITGIQRVVKESIFSQLNNILVFTVLDDYYAPYFGLTYDETKMLIEAAGLEMSEEMCRKYDGYFFGGISMYNPWSVLNYAFKKHLDNFWANTSSNLLIRRSIVQMDDLFKRDFNKLMENGEVEVSPKLETSFFELQNAYTLWGLLINAGYLTVSKYTPGRSTMIVRIPNGEVNEEFVEIIAQISNVPNTLLHIMIESLMDQNMVRFVQAYKDIVLSYTSFYDAKENAYHMLFLGMCISLAGRYRITSNIESGHGRSDIKMESLYLSHPHIIIEFKQGEDLDKLKYDALDQIESQQYYFGLKGEVLCLGVAHDKKRCEIAWRTVTK